MWGHIAASNGYENEAVSLSATARLAALYLERIAHYQAHPPGDDWDGVWTMTSKSAGSQP
jgi:hypothetical protein